MLAHQLPMLPPYESFWSELPAFFAWLAGGSAPRIPAAYAVDAGDVVLRQRDLRLPVSGRAQSFVEIIRFAAGNRLLVDLMYLDSTCRIEPYSLRRTQEGKIVLHAWDIDKNEHCSFRVDRIQGALATDQSFEPRYAVELSPHGPVLAAPPAASSEPDTLRETPLRTAPAPSTPHATTESDPAAPTRVRLDPGNGLFR